MIALLNWRVWAAVALAVGLAASHWKVYKLGEQNVQAKWDAQSLEVAKQSLRLSEEATRTTVDLEAKAQLITETKNAQIAATDARLAAALDRVRPRPQRPSAGDMSTDAAAQSTTGCTGAGLYREDASAFIREAARANRLRALLGECQAKYESAYKAMNHE
jgi:hypothetical protein